MNLEKTLSARGVAGLKIGLVHDELARFRGGNTFHLCFKLMRLFNTTSTAYTRLGESPTVILCQLVIELRALMMLPAPTWSTIFLDYCDLD